jgi:hypothetical protein
MLCSLTDSWTVEAVLWMGTAIVVVLAGLSILKLKEILDNG